MYKTLENYNNTRENYIENSDSDMPSAMPGDSCRVDAHRDMLSLLDSLNPGQLKDIITGNANSGIMDSFGIDPQYQDKFVQTLQKLAENSAIALEMSTDMSMHEDQHAGNLESDAAVMGDDSDTRQSMPEYSGYGSGVLTYDEILEMLRGIRPDNMNQVQAQLSDRDMINGINQAIPTLSRDQIQQIKNQMDPQVFKIMMSKMSPDNMRILQDHGFTFEQL